MVMQIVRKLEIKTRICLFLVTGRSWWVKFSERPVSLEAVIGGGE